ncbi:MAG: hypothetical protein WD578_10450 [Bacteroidales bacterium]
MNLPFLSVSLFMMSISYHIQCQTGNGPYPAIHNGTVYNYVAIRTGGHQYLDGEMYFYGTLTINNTTYRNLELNYDIFNQAVLFKYGTGSGRKVISIPVETISEFTIHDRSFEVIHVSDWDYTIYEKIGDGKWCIYYQWSKDIKTASQNELNNYEFSKSQKTIYLSDSSEFIKIRGKRDFLKAFGADNKKDLKKFMRTNRIRFKSVSNIQMRNLLNFCNSI